MKFDIKKFFDSVDHEILMGILEKRIASVASLPRNDTDQVVGLLNEVVGSYSTSNSVGGGAFKERSDSPSGT